MPTVLKQLAPMQPVLLQLAQPLRVPMSWAGKPSVAQPMVLRLLAPMQLVVLPLARPLLVRL
jgi:hypothetical protein